MHFFVAHDTSSFMPGPDLVYTSKCLQSVPYTKCSCKVYLVSKMLVLAVFSSPRLFCTFGPNLTKCAAKVNIPAFVLLQYVQLMFM